MVRTCAACRCAACAAACAACAAACAAASGCMPCMGCAGDDVLTGRGCCCGCGCNCCCGRGGCCCCSCCWGWGCKRCCWCGCCCCCCCGCCGCWAALKGCPGACPGRGAGDCPGWLCMVQLLEIQERSLCSVADLCLKHAQERRRMACIVLHERNAALAYVPWVTAATELCWWLRTVTWCIPQHIHI